MARATEREGLKAVSALLTGRARPLAFGVAVSLVTTGLLQKFNPQLLADSLDRLAIAYLAGLAGIVTAEVVFHPVFIFLAYHTRLIEILIQRRVGLMGDKSFDRIKRVLDDWYFLGRGVEVSTGEGSGGEPADQVAPDAPSGQLRNKAGRAQGGGE
jgi:hypothetical protein